MKKIQNEVHLEGYVYDFSLEKRVTGEAAKVPGQEYIRGTLSVATDDEALNVVPVNFSFVTPKFAKSGKENSTYKTLLTILESEGRTYQDVGTDAIKVKVDTATGLNDFYNQQDELVTYKICDGGFVHIVNTLSGNRNRFEVDMFINGTYIKEGDEELGTEDSLVVKGATFNFANQLLPLELIVRSEGGMKYFEELGATSEEPVFIKVWGQIIATTIETQTIEESAFGADAVKISTRRFRDWEITGAATEPYPYGDEAVLTANDVQEAMQKREQYLAATKARHDDYVASKNSSGGQNFAAPAGAAASPAPAPQNKSFDF